MSDHDYLTGLLREIADIAGLPAALAIAECKGGIEAYFPAEVCDDHWLVKACGREAAAKICAHFCCTGRGGMRLHVPLGPHRHHARARRLVSKILREHGSKSKAARAAGVDISTVKRIKRRLRDVEGDPQGSLF